MSMWLPKWSTCCTASAGIGLVSMLIELTFWPGNGAGAQMGDVLRAVDAAGVGVGGAVGEQVLHGLLASAVEPTACAAGTWLK